MPSSTYLPRAALLFNSAASRAGDLAALRAKLETRFDLVHLTTRWGADDVRRALEVAPDLVVAAGGDGTVSAVASELRGTEIALGILPLGTSNSVATALAIPNDLDAAVDVLATGERRLVDTATANERAMLLHASVGLHAAAVTGASPEAKKRWGVLAYLAEGIFQLAELLPFDVEIATESEIIRCQAVNVSVANIAPRKTVLAQGPAVVSPTDGALGVTVVTATSLAEAVATGLHLLDTARRDEPATRDNVGHLSARRVSISANPAQPLVIDGEEAEGSRLDVTCWPESLVVIVPQALELRSADVGEKKLEGLPGLEIRNTRCKH